MEQHDSGSDGQGGGLTRRLFLRRMVSGAAGVAILGGLPGISHAVDEIVKVPLLMPEDGEDLDAKGAKGVRRKLGALMSKTDVSVYPAVALVGAGEAAAPWVVWSEEKDERGSILLRKLKAGTGEWDGEAVAIAGGGEKDPMMRYQSRMAASPDGSVVWVAWTERMGTASSVMAKRVDAVNQAGKSAAGVAVTPEGEHGQRPEIAVLADGSLAVVFERRNADQRRVEAVLRTFGATGDRGADFVLPRGGPGDSLALRDQRRPVVAVGPKGDTLAVAWDEALEDGSTHVYLTFFPVGASLRPVEPKAQRLSEEAGQHLSADVAFSQAGDVVYAAWHTNAGPGGIADIPRWYRVRAVQVDGAIAQDVAWPPPNMDLTKSGQDQGVEFVKLVVGPQGQLCVLGRASHRFLLQILDGSGWSPLYRFPRQTWGGRSQHARGVFDSKGQLWVVRRDWGETVIDCVEGIVAAGPDAGTPKVRASAAATALAGAAPALAGRIPRVEFPKVVQKEAEGGAAGSTAAAAQGLEAGGADGSETYRAYFGDLHQHTWMSDGMGDADEPFRRGRDLLGYDFMALTDHDHFVRRRVYSAEYEEQKDLVDQFYEPGRFATLYAQEWTTGSFGTKNGFGHKCVYAIQREHPYFDHFDERWQKAESMLAACREHGMLAFPHHTGFTGTDWDAFKTFSDVQTVAEIVSIHGAYEYMGNEPIPHRNGVRGMFIQDGLKLGHKFGLIGGSDQHGLIWQHGAGYKRDSYHGGMTGLYAKELTREGIFDAFRKRRTFATSGARIRPVFRVAGLFMGEEGTVSGPPRISADVLAESDIKWVKFVRNGEVIQAVGGMGPRLTFSLKDESIPENRTSFYYLRIELRDGHMAWTSPVWVTPTA